jgi:hypothetical protein
LDVDADGSINPLDALLVINRLNSGAVAAGGSGSGAEGESSPKLYYDVTGDRVISPLDALLVINHLNAPNGGASAAEGESAITLGPQIEPLVDVPETRDVQITGAVPNSPVMTALVLPGGWSKDRYEADVPSGSAKPVTSEARTRSQNEARQTLFALHASKKQRGVDSSVRSSGDGNELNVTDLVLIDLEADVFDSLAAEVAARWGY